MDETERENVVTTEAKRMEFVIENINNSNIVQLLTLMMTGSACAQRGEAFLMACLHLIPLFQAVET